MICLPYRLSCCFIFISRKHLNYTDAVRVLHRCVNQIHVRSPCNASDKLPIKLPFCCVQAAWRPSVCSPGRLQTTNDTRDTAAESLLSNFPTDSVKWNNKLTLKFCEAVGGRYFGDHPSSIHPLNNNLLPSGGLECERNVTLHAVLTSEWESLLSLHSDDALQMCNHRGCG